MMREVYRLLPVLDVPEYEGFAWHDRLGSVRNQPNATMDFEPDKAPPGEQEVAPRLAQVWKPVKVIGNVRPWNDYPCINLRVPVFSRRAVDALRDLLEPNGELLPLISEVGEYYAYNVTTVADVLDEERSEVNWGLDRAYASRIIRFEFHPDRLEGLSIFRFPQTMNQYLVTEVFARRVREHRLQGFGLSKVWPLPPDADWWRMRLDRSKRWQREARNYRRKHGKDATEPPLEPWRDC